MARSKCIAVNRGCLSTIFIVGYLVYWIMDNQNPSSKIEDPVDLDKDLRCLTSNITLQSHWGNEVEYLVNSSNCQIPSLDPYHLDLLPYFQPKKYIKCHYKGLLTYVAKVNNVATLHIDERFINEYSNEGVQCCFSTITRGDDSEKPDSIVNISACVDFSNNVTLLAKFILVTCRSRESNKEVYKNAHAIVTITEEVQQIIQNDENLRQNHLSVLLVGIDSISRTNFMRSLPLTNSVLQKTGWIEFKGYNKIGLNTFPNLMGILTGMNETTAFERCDPRKVEGLDKCEMIWYDYRKLGFVTGYGEDEAQIGTFNYVKEGFRHEPTDYYFRPYVIATEKHLPFLLVDVMRYCTGPEAAGERILNVANDFATTFNDFPSFGLFWVNSFSHNALNGVSRMDQKVYDFLVNIYENGVLENSVVIFFSDHGYRFGSPFLYTHTGWLEEKLPFFFMSVPQWLRDKHPDKYRNLIANTERLTTPYDLYMTLQDVLVLSGTNYTMKKSSACPNCKSLFDVIETERSCEDAAIERQWCACTGYLTISNETSIAVETAKFIIKEIRKLQISISTDYQRCSDYELKQIIYAGMSDNSTSPLGVSYFLIIFQTQPTAVFQGTASVDWTAQTPYFKNEGKIHRLDFYGATSKCVNDPILREYCYC